MATAIGAGLLATFVPVLLLLLFRWRRKAAKWKGLPPGLPAWPILGHLPNLLASKDGLSSGFEDLVRRSLRSLGGLFTLWLLSKPLVIVADAALAHEALISKGSAFADRPIPRRFRALFSHGGRTINSARYGPLWRTLRANLVSGILSPASLGHFRLERRRALDRLVHDLLRESASSSASGQVRPRKHLRRALFRIVAALCFGVGSNDDDAALEELMAALHQMLRSGLSLNDSRLMALMPWKWRQARQIQRRIYAALLPFMRRAQAPSYAATLRDAATVGVAADDEQYMAVLCSEFLVAATDTTATTLEWALAHITRLPEVQRRLHREVAAAHAEDEENLVCSGKMQYVEAVVMETLRRNPPGHFVLNHAVTEETEVAGYRLPAQTVVNFYGHGMGMDPAVWENPQEFRPERFIMRSGGGGKTWWDEDKEKDEDEEVSSAKKRLLRMMPFGAGRRICPGIGLALLHMHLIVARLVRCFEWKEVSPIDMTESLNFTVQMKQRLCAVISQR